MFKLLNRYIIHFTLLNTFSVCFIFSGLLLFISLVGQLGDIGGQFSIFDAVLYSLMQLPYLLYQLSPIAVLIGVIVSLGRLADDNQLVVMRASGFSLAQVVQALFQATLILLIIFLLLGEVLSPILLKKAEALKSPVLLQKASTVTNVWLKKDDDFIHINSIVNQDHLVGFKQLAFSQRGRLERIVFARDVIRKQGEWQFFGLKQIQFLKNKVVISPLNTYQLRFSIAVKPLKASRASVNTLTIPQLWRVLKYRQEIGLLNGTLSYVFWERVFYPISLFIIVCLAIPFSFMSKRTVSLLKRVIYGLALGFAFFILNQSLGLATSVIQISGWVLALIPILLFAIISLVLFRRIN